MKEFNWSEFKDTNNIIAVHCKTEEEAKDFCKQMHEHGMRWLERAISTAVKINVRNVFYATLEIAILKTTQSNY